LFTVAVQCERAVILYADVIHTEYSTLIG